MNTAQRVVLILGALLVGFLLLSIFDRRGDATDALALVVPIALLVLGVSPEKWWRR